MNRAERRMSGIRGRRGTVAGLTFLAASTMVTAYGQILRAPWAMAATISCTVNSNGDTGTGSSYAPWSGDLRFCMTKIQANADGGTISFGSGITTVTLSLSLPDIVKDTTITGGDRNVTITAGGTGIRFLETGSNGLDVTLDHLTVKNFEPSGSDHAGRGPVLYDRKGANVSISDCTFSSNTGGSGSTILAVSTSGVGDPTLSITRTTFEDNVSSEYGAVHFFSVNPLTIVDSTFSENSATSGAGAIYDMGNHSTTISGSTFSGNTTPGSSGLGGAIYSWATSLEISDSTFSGNSASKGGAIYAFNNLTVTDSTFSGNSAGRAGGAVYGKGTLTVTDSSFSSNSSDGSGGAIYDYGSHATTIEGSTFSGNSAVETNGNGFGGAVYAFDSTLDITDSTFSGNSAEHGGAVFSNSSGATTATRSSFYNNSALFTGAIAANNVTLTNSFVGHNHSTSTYTNQLTTGGVYTTGNTALQFSTVYANSVTARYGFPGDFRTMSQMNVQGALVSTASIIAAAANSGGDGAVFSNNHLYSYTVLTGSSAYPTPVPISTPGSGFKVGPGQVGLETLPPSPSASPGRLGQAPMPTSVVYTAAPTANPLPSASPSITADQVGAPRPDRNVGASAWTIGSRQLAAGASPSPSASPTSTSSPSPSSSPTVAPAPSPESGGSSTSTPSASASSTLFVPTPEAVWSSLAPGGSSLLIDGRPATGLVVAPNSSSNGLDARGPGFTMTVHGQSTGGRPVALGQSNTLRVGPGGRVESRGTGFRSGSQVGVFVDPSTAPTRLRKTPRAAGTSVGTLKVNALGAFDGTVTLPANLAPGTHILQIVGQAPDGSTRAVNLGIEVVQQPGVVTISASRRDKSGQVVTITGRVTGVDASTVVPYVRSGKNPKPSAVTTRPVVAADGTFTWRLRNPSTVTVFVTAGGVRSNRLAIPKKSATGVSTTPITKQRPVGSTN